MRLTGEMTYPGPVDDVFAMMTDAAFWRAVADATHALHSSVSVHDDGEGAVVHVVRTMPAQVPELVRTMVGDEMQIEQTERWSAADDAGRRTADLLLAIVGKPVRFPATMVLESTPSGSRQTVAGRIEVRIPIGGRAIASEIAKAIRSAMVVQQQVAYRYLLGGTASDG